MIRPLCRALGAGDIGTFFPNTDPRQRGSVFGKNVPISPAPIALHNGLIINVDATVMAEQPKISPHVFNMKTHIAAALKINVQRVGLKATTNEHLGFIGRGEGIAAMAVASVELPG